MSSEFPNSSHLSLDRLHEAIPQEYRSEIPSTPKSLPSVVNDGKLLPKSYAEYALKLISAYCRAMKDAMQLYLPLPTAEDFHACTDRVRLVKGSNRSGKTQCATGEFARIIRGKDPYLKRKTSDLIALAVGKDQKHLGDPMWRKLYFPGAFDIVPDEVTGMWRSVRPDPNNQRMLDPIDDARRALWKPAPPFLPPSCIQKLSYENKAEGVPSLVILKNGTHVWFCASGGFPRQGTSYDLVWFDEEIENKNWLGESLRGLVQREGIFMWSYTPQGSTPQAYDLSRRAAAGEPDIRTFFLSIEDNPYLTQKAKQAFYRDCAAEGPEALAIKWYGKDAIAGRMVYPGYDLDIQGIERHEIPNNWMRVAAIDPGTRFAAVLFGAVPPGATHLEIYDEIVVENQDAFALGQAFRRIAGIHNFEAVIIDKKGSQPRAPGRSIGDSTADHYQREFKRAGVKPNRLGGSGFIFSNPDCQARELSVKGHLAAKTLLFHRGRTNRLDRQIKNRYYDKNNANRREYRTEHDLVDCYDSQTEVLTDSGWKLFGDVNGSEMLATVNLTTDTLEYQSPSRIINKPYSGKMVKIGGGSRQRVDMLVTPSHRMVIQKQLSKEPTIVEASQLCKYDRIKAAAKNWSGRDYECPFDCELGDFAEFLGWYVSEGSCKKPRCPGHGYGVVISQVKKEGRDRLEWLFSRLPFKWYDVTSGYQSSSNKKLWGLLNPLGNSYTKKLPEWIRWAKPEIIQRFLDGAFAGDGWKRDGGGLGYCSVSKELADGMQELILKTGRATSIILRKAAPSYSVRVAAPVYGKCRDQWHVFTRNKSLLGLYNHEGSTPNFRTVDYSGTVHCATVPNGTLVVRRNGKVSVCGNCLEYVVAFFDGGLYHREPPAPRPAEMSRRDAVVYKTVKELNKPKRRAPPLALRNR